MKLIVPLWYYTYLGFVKYSVSTQQNHSGWSFSRKKEYIVLLD